MLNRRFFAYLFLIILSGCRVGPRYDPPCTEVPEEWKNSHTENCNGPPVEYWWEVFEDSILNYLECQAIANNPNLYVALEKIFEARAQAGVVAANLYPQVSLDPGFTDTGMLFKPQLPAGLLTPQGAAASGRAAGSVTNTIAPFRVHQMQYLLPLNLNYEIDLWGKLRDRTDSAVFFAEAQAESYCSALLTLTADLASSYFQARTLDAEIAYFEKTLETRHKNLQLTQARFDKGVVNYLDVTQAEADFFSVKANLDESERLRAVAENQIAVLIGTLPTNFHLATSPLETPPPKIPAGVPSTILLKRPDISQAERLIASEFALVGAAYASFFPSLNLTGALGYSSPDISQFLKWISRFWAIGGNISQTILDGGRDYSNLQLAYARFKEASGSYQQQVLIAFQEVEDALKNIEQYERQSEHLLQVVQASGKATKLSMNRYVTGVAIYLEVIENERQELQAKVNWIRTLNSLYTSTIQLIKALGGSWEVSCPMSL